MTVALTVDDIVALHGADDLTSDDFSSMLDLSNATLVTSASGAVIIDDASGATPDTMSAALKMLVQVCVPEFRSVAVLGELDVDPADANDAHDAIGRLVVRLNVQKLVVVGHAARHIHNAAGLEGSWDGESVMVDSVDGAYDLLRDNVGPGDIVLVKSSARAGLGSLAGRLAAS